jgi:hypothetical protein
MLPIVHQHSLFGTSALVKTSEIVEKKKIHFNCRHYTFLMEKRDYEMKLYDIVKRVK